MTTVREIRLRTRPNGVPTADIFELVAVDLPAPRVGQVEVKNLWLTVDPYMRGRMEEGESYVAPFQLGQVLEGGAIGRVVASEDPSLQVGDVVLSYFGWREGFVAPASAVERLEPGKLPPQTFLGGAGMPGLTAYAGLLKVAALKAGDVVFVSGAAGAVGSMVVQIAKAKGHTVIASAGGPRKTAFLKQIGADHVIDYKAESDLTAALARVAPNGIDVYFDNVGGEHLEAALNAAKPFGRFVLCGAISMYNAVELPPGPRNLVLAIGKQLRLQGFIVDSYADLAEAFRGDLAQWFDDGKVKLPETVFEGLERTPDAFLGLFAGENLGKMLVRLA